MDLEFESEPMVVDAHAGSAAHSTQIGGIDGALGLDAELVELRRLGVEQIVRQGGGRLDARAQPSAERAQP